MRMERQEWLRDSDSMMKHAILISITDSIDVDFINTAAERIDGSVYDNIILTLNGVELSLRHFFERLEQSLDKDIEIKAGEIVKDGLADKMYDIESLLFNLHDYIKDRLIENNIPLDGDEETY